MGQSLPVSLKENRTQQQEAYSLTELKAISLYDGTYKKDHVNKSQPIFDFGCKPEVFQPRKDREHVWIGRTIGAALGSAVVVILIAYVTYKCCYKKTLLGSGESFHDEQTGRAPTQGNTGVVRLDSRGPPGQFV